MQFGCGLVHRQDEVVLARAIRRGALHALLESNSMFKGIEHTAIASANPQQLAQWYVDHLEFVINYTYGGNYFVKAKNGAMLEIIPAEGEFAVPKLKDPGIRHLAIIGGRFRRRIPATAGAKA